MEPPETDPHSGHSTERLYTNYLQVGRNRREVVLEFGQYHEGDAAPRIHTRLVTHPGYLLDFLKTIEDALASDMD